MSHIFEESFWGRKRWYNADLVDKSFREHDESLKNCYLGRVHAECENIKLKDEIRNLKDENEKLRNIITNAYAQIATKGHA